MALATKVRVIVSAGSNLIDSQLGACGAHFKQVAQMRWLDFNRLRGECSEWRERQR